MIYSQHAFMQKQGLTMITSVQAVLNRSPVIFSKFAEVSKFLDTMLSLKN